MKYNSNNTPIECMMTQSTCYKGTKKMTVKGILWHSTGANNSTLKRYVQPDDDAPNRDELIKIIGKNLYGNDWNHVTRQAGVNAWIGKLADGTVATVQAMPWDYRPWGCGTGSKGSCNDGWIQFEICEDNLTNKTYFDAIYKEACELTAYLCKIFNIDPKGTTTLNGVTVPTILCHKDSHALGLGSNHGDVIHWFSKHGKSMETARADVAELLNPTVVTPKPVDNSFKVGDVVEITGTKYYNGKTVPSWVRKKTWVVHTVSGDRVVVNKSSDGKNAIMSSLNASALTLVSAVKTEPSTTTTTTTTTKPSTTTKPATTTNTTTTAPSASVSTEKQVIKKGSVVSISKGAKYYNGASVPSWVINKKWIVKEDPKGDRVIIDKSSDGKNAICSAINSKYLSVVSNGSASTTVTTSNTTTTTTTTTKPVVTTTNAVIKKGSKVKVNSGAKTYTGKKLAAFVYKTTYTVLEEPKGDRVVIGLKGIATAAMNKKDLTLV